ncbi:MAG: two-component regulator propeller domain-containing protein, partial [bacterium]
MKSLAVFLILPLLMTVVSPGHAQFNAREHRIQTFTVESGLSQSSIWCMIQDSRGFMWFGTADGLNRFDGYAFKVFRHDAKDPSSLRSNTVWSLLEDRAGNIWVGTVSGLQRFDCRTETFTYLPDDSIFHSANLRTV